MYPTNKKNRVIEVLLVYYCILQLAHFITLIRAGIILITEGRVPFPAVPPEPGWTNQALYFLIGMSIFDVGNIIGAFIFAYAYFTSKRWYGWFGIINLTAMMSSGIFFTLGTFPSGAWFNYPFEYLLLVLLFIPVIVLFFTFIYVEFIKSI